MKFFSDEAYDPNPIPYGRKNWYLVGWEQETVEKNGKKKTVLVYKGQYFGYDIDEKKLRNLKIAYAALTVAMTVLYIIAATSGAICYEYFYVGIPYLLAMIPYMPFLIGVCCLLPAKPPMTYRTFYATYMRYTFFNKFLVGLFSVALVGDFVHLFRMSRGAVIFFSWRAEVLFTVCVAGCLACSLVILWLCYKYPAFRIYVEPKKVKSKQ